MCPAITLPANGLIWIHPLRLLANTTHFLAPLRQVGAQFIQHCAYLPCSLRKLLFIVDVNAYHTHSLTLLVPHIFFSSSFIFRATSLRVGTS